MPSSNQSSTKASPESAAASERTAATTCVCGKSKTTDSDVILHPEYNLSGWFLLAFGVTVTPKRIVYQCRDCGRKFAATTDPVELERHA